jgi:serine/threonine protein kinase/Tfp pilus assembly protein PilF
MNGGSGDPDATPGQMIPDESGAIAICPKCGTKMPASRSSDRCPVCQLRAALAPELLADPVTSRAASVPADPGKQANELSSHKFGHYELLTGPEGAPVELGRGAMGVTYKAIDNNLRCVVALKVINARNLENESARIRFVREARSAARIRHPNVASVFHLGTKGDNYFYAMEFVEGENLEHLIRRQGPLDIALALDITDQVAAALGAAQKEQIVHRDIKPANIMVAFGENGSARVKVIDFGLAKPVAGSQSEPALSMPGTFAGTAYFASPEQCTGAEVDVRSDIYSLGVTLWEMLVGKVPFSGTTSEVIRHHLSTPLPLGQLANIPKPVVTLLERMLEKNPADRPQDPASLRAALSIARNTLKSDNRSYPDAISQLTKARQRSRWRGTWPASIGIIIVFLALVVLFGLHFFGLTSGSNVIGKSVAVLPFDNLSDNKENEYFSDALTSEVIYELSKVPDLRVTARSSILRYTDSPTVHRKPLNEIGKELAVGSILESSVERVADRVKIVTILYDARTNRSLWSASYDREMIDVFAIQSDVAEQIAAALQVTLSADERSDFRRKPTENASAYDLYLRGRALCDLHRQEDNDQAIELFKKALEQDPKFVLAYVGLAGAYIDRVKRFHGESFWLDSAISLCQEAIALDPKQLRAYTELANAFNLKGSFDQMSGPVRTALELAPNDWDANRMAAAEYTEARREGDMYASIRKCFLTNPYDSWAPYQLALVCWTVGANELAEKWMQRAIDLEPDPQKRRLMECERLVYTEDYAAALPEVERLPPDLKTQYSSAGDLDLFCLAQLGNWPAVIRGVQVKLAADSENPTALMRLAIALYRCGQDADAQGKAERVVTIAKQKLPTAKSPRWMHYDLAVGFRMLSRLEDAYRELRGLLANRGFPDPVLGPKDPGLDFFKGDNEFKDVMADLNRQNEIKRARILAIEKSFSDLNNGG